MMSPEWIEALAAVALAVLTFLTLIVLKGYAEDTKKIAKASVEQVENSQKPFVMVVLKPGNPANHFDGGWHIENQGFGPALNMRYASPLDVNHWEFDIPVLRKGEYRYLSRFVVDQVQNREFKIEYESLSRKKYRTSIVWAGQETTVTFNGPL